MLSKAAVFGRLDRLARERRERQPDAAADVDQYVLALKDRLARTVLPRRSSLRDVPDILHACSEISDPLLEPSAALQELMGDYREQFIASLIDAQYQPERLPAGADRDTTRELRRIRDRRSALALAQIIPAARAEQDRALDEGFLKSRCREAFSVLRETVFTFSRRSGEQPFFDWDRVRSMLPPALRERFVVDTRIDRFPYIEEGLQRYWLIAERLGGTRMLCDLLFSLGLEPAEFERAIRHIRLYLGAYAGGNGPGPGREPQPEVDFDEEEPDAVLTHWCMQQIYRQLRDSGFDDVSPPQHRLERTSLRTRAERELRTALGDDADTLLAEHTGVLADVLRQWQQAGETPMPSRLRDTLTIKGQTYNFASLRQWLAAFALRKPGSRKLVIIPQGRGKTEAMLLTYELFRTGKSKALIICPHNLIDTVLERIRGCDRPGEERESCYKPDQIPVVGVIRSKGQKGRLTGAELEQELAQEIVLVPYSMLGATVDGQLIRDHIVEYRDPGQRRFDFLGVDEIQRARKAEKGGKSYTESVFHLAAHLPGLLRHGRVGFYSADPFPGGLDALPAYLRVFSEQEYGDTQGTRARVGSSDAVRLRNALALRWIFNIDGRIDWKQYLRRVEHTQYPEERKGYEEIRMNEFIDPPEKLGELLRFIENPALYLGRRVPSSFLEMWTQSCGDDLTKKNASFFIQHTFNRGILRPHRTRDPQGRLVFLSFACEELCSLLRQRFGCPVRLHLFGADAAVRKYALQKGLLQADGDDVVDLSVYVVEGKTTPIVRQRAVAAARQAERRKVDPVTGRLPDGRRSPKVLVCIQMETGMTEGLDFSPCKRMGFPWKPYNLADMGQAIMRLPRDGDTDDIEAWVMIALGTVQEGIEKQAEFDYTEVEEFLEGRDRGAQYYEQGAEKLLSDVRSGKGRMKLRDMWHLCMTRRQYMAIVFSRLFNAGEQAYRTFVEEQGETAADIYTEGFERTMAATNAKITAGSITALERMVREGKPVDGADHALLSAVLARTGGTFTDIVDAASGPFSLQWALGSIDEHTQRKRSLYHVDINPHMFALGKILLIDQGLEKLPWHRVGSIARLREHLPAGKRMQLLHCGLALEYTQLNAKRRRESLLEDERVRTLLHFNASLELGGIMILTLPPGICSPDDLANVCGHALPLFGFRALPQFTGFGRSTDHRQGYPFENTMIACQKAGEADPVWVQRELQLAHLRFSKAAHGQRTGAGRPAHRRRCTGVEVERSSPGHFHIQPMPSQSGPTSLSSPLVFSHEVDSSKRRQGIWQFYRGKAQIIRALLQTEDFQAFPHLMPDRRARFEARLEAEGLSLFRAGRSHKGCPLFFCTGDPDPFLIDLDDERLRA